jgi:hypothetical protein
MNNSPKNYSALAAVLESCVGYYDPVAGPRVFIFRCYGGLILARIPVKAGLVDGGLWLVSMNPESWLPDGSKTLGNAYLWPESASRAIAVSRG